MMAVLGLCRLLSVQPRTRVAPDQVRLAHRRGLGNLVDRARFGFVTDFIRNGPNAFNIADIAIFAGGIIVLVGLVASVLRMRMRQPTSNGA